MFVGCRSGNPFPLSPGGEGGLRLRRRCSNTVRQLTKRGGLRGRPFLCYDSCMKTYKFVVHLEFDAEDFYAAERAIDIFYRDFEVTMNDQEGQERSGTFFYLDEEAPTMTFKEVQEVEYRGNIK